MNTSIRTTTLGLIISTALSGVLLLPHSVGAFDPQISVSEGPSHKFLLGEDIYIKREYYGQLDGSPHLYEFSISEPTSLLVSVYTPKLMTNPLTFLAL